MKAKRFQFVFWWHPSVWTVGFERFAPEQGIGWVYRWQCAFGPLELRRWR